MDVFVIPISRDRYELYCETESSDPDEAAMDDAADQAPAGVIGRLRHQLSPRRLRRRFSLLLKAAERRQHGETDGDEPKGWAGRAQDWMLTWIVERIAEQRLLWNLRRQTSAVLAHPEDMTFEQVLRLVRGKLQHDFERHLRWLVVDTLLFIASGVLALVPGPNVLAYYFLFRVVGHWLSMRGALQGLSHVTFTSRPCPPLAELRDLAGLEPATREQRVHDIADRLRLQHLTTFFERVAVQ